MLHFDTNSLVEWDNFTPEVKQLLFSMNCIHMGQFGQFVSNEFKQGQTHFSQLPISLDPDELNVWAVIARNVPK